MSGGTDDVREWVNLRGLFIIVSTVEAAYEEKFAETSLRFSEYVTQTIHNVVVKCQWSSMVTVTFGMTYLKQYLVNDRMIVVTILAALFESLSNSRQLNIDQTPSVRLHNSTQRILVPYQHAVGGDKQVTSVPCRHRDKKIGNEWSRLSLPSPVARALSGKWSAKSTLFAWRKINTNSWPTFGSVAGFLV